MHVEKSNNDKEFDRTWHIGEMHKIVTNFNFFSWKTIYRIYNSIASLYLLQLNIYNKISREYIPIKNTHVSTVELGCFMCEK